MAWEDAQPPQEMSANALLARRPMRRVDNVLKVFMMAVGRIERCWIGSRTGATNSGFGHFWRH